MKLPLILVTSTLLIPPTLGDDIQLTVKTTTGTYTGFINTNTAINTPNVAQWLGIPYARPPLGPLRFRAPQPLPPAAVNSNNNTAVDAKSYKPICMQDGLHTGVFWELVPEFQNTDPQSEDCLYLNIWAPAPPKPATAAEVQKEKLLPVIIWVCGGSYREGGGHAPYQVPDRWVERTRGHLVVTFNYRLNVFGFPGLRGGDENRNVGLMDARIL